MYNANTLNFNAMPTLMLLSDVYNEHHSRRLSKSVDRGTTPKANIMVCCHFCLATMKTDKNCALNGIGCLQRKSHRYTIEYLVKGTMKLRAWLVSHGNVIHDECQHKSIALVISETSGLFLLTVFGDLISPGFIIWR